MTDHCRQHMKQCVRVFHSFVKALLVSSVVEREQGWMHVQTQGACVWLFFWKFPVVLLTAITVLTTLCLSEESTACPHVAVFGPHVHTYSVYRWQGNTHRAGSSTKTHRLNTWLTYSTNMCSGLRSQAVLWGPWAPPPTHTHMLQVTGINHSLPTPARPSQILISLIMSLLMRAAFPSSPPVFTMPLA